MSAQREVDHPIIAASPAMRHAVAIARRFAPTELPILLMGPTGSGKELFARQIHQWSEVRGELVDVNAGALPRDMVESLLFGHRRGAFTGAATETEGLIVAAREGTLFLDELASLPAEGQAKLLRALECGEVRRLGDTVTRQVRCRFVAAVPEDIEGRVDRGEFRLDLYQRLAGVVIRLPPLTERSEDIAPLGRAFARAQGRGLSVCAEGVLKRYAWPGNVRELKIAVQRARFLADAPSISGEVMREAIALGRAGVGWEGVDEVEQQGALALVEACRAHDWHVGRAARALGVGQATLYRRLREAGVDLQSRRRTNDLGAAMRQA